MIDTIVIGGGAAGMMAAIAAASNGLKVLLVERNEKLGKKIYITGKGRCNLTNRCEVDDFLLSVPQNPKFLYSALNNFSPENAISYFNENNCKLKTERGNRVYPESEKASDITKTLHKILLDKKVEILLNSRVEKLSILKNKLKGVILENGDIIKSKTVVIATGGCSYPITGSTGDGYTLAKQVGHDILNPLPALVPLETKEEWPLALQGLSLKNVRLVGIKGKRKSFDNLGEMIFTHFGYSGPLILKLSSFIQGDKLSKWKFFLDLKPGMTHEEIEIRLLKNISDYPNASVDNMMRSFLPKRLAQVFIQEIKVDGSKAVNSVTKAERQLIGQKLKEFILPISGFRSFKEAVITRGGVSVKEVYSNTLESRICPGLFFAGEVLDVDALTGGFNIQIALSTGVLAGQSIDYFIKNSERL